MYTILATHRNFAIVDFDPWRNLIVTEDFYVRMITPSGEVKCNVPLMCLQNTVPSYFLFMKVTTIAGEGVSDRPRDGPGLAARFQRVQDLFILSAFT